MKILFLSAANSIHTIKWVNALVEKGHEVVLVSNKGHEPKEDALDNRIQFYCLKYSGNLGYFLNAKELSILVKKIKPTVINVHYASGYGTLARIAKLPPYLLSVWGSDVYDFPYESKIKNRILKKNIKNADMLASTSKCMAQQLRKVMSDSSLEIAITPFGVDLELFNPSLYAKSKNNEFIVGTVKALESKYGIFELIQAFEKLNDEIKKNEQFHKTLKLEIYGDGSQKEEIQSYINQKGLASQITLKGKIPNKDVPSAIASFDVFVVLSQLDSESFGVAAVEAMAMGKAVVATDVDGFKEVISNEKTGIIVSRHSVEDAEKAILKVALDPTYRTNLGKNGRKRVEENYDWDKNVNTMLKLYEKMDGII